jgi:hypothetical protein
MYVIVFTVSESPIAVASESIVITPREGVIDTKPQAEGYARSAVRVHAGAGRGTATFVCIYLWCILSTHTWPPSPLQMNTP